MAAHAFELSYRLGAGFQGQELCALIAQVVKEIGFDESTRYDLTLDGADGQRVEEEGSVAENEQVLLTRPWAGLHQVQFANQWIKDMNVKLTVVRRPGGSVVTLRGETDRPEAARRMTAALDRQLQAWQQSETACLQHQQERERSFGAMLLAPSVAGPVREPFLRGDYAGALLAAGRVLSALVERRLGLRLSDSRTLSTALTSRPPKLLFPDRSGAGLQHELDALSHLFAGVSQLLRTYTGDGSSLPSEPSQVLKVLVLVSLLVERLESATPNPAARAGGRAPHRRPAVHKPRAASGKPRTASGKPRTASGKPRIASRKPRTASRKPRTVSRTTRKSSR